MHFVLLLVFLFCFLSEASEEGRMIPPLGANSPPSGEQQPPSGVKPPPLGGENSAARANQAVLFDLANLAVYDADPKVRLMSAQTLGKLGSNNPDLHFTFSQGLDDPDRTVQLEVIRGLPELHFIFSQGLDDPDRTVQLEVIRGLGSMNPSLEIRNRIAQKVIWTKTPHVRLAAIITLGELNTGPFLEELPAADSSKAQAQRSAVYAFKHLKNDITMIRSIARSAVNARMPEVRKISIWAASRLNLEDSVVQSFILKTLYDSEPEVKLEGIHVLSRIRLNSSALRRLAKMLSSAFNSEVRMAALMVLRAQGEWHDHSRLIEPFVIQKVVKNLKHRWHSIRIASANVLAAFQSDEEYVRKALMQRVLEDKKPEVRRASLLALGELSPEEALLQEEAAGLDQKPSEQIQVIPKAGLKDDAFAAQVTRCQQAFKHKGNG